MQRKKILLVDDSNIALMMEQLILKSGAWDVVVAHDGVEGYQKAIADRPDLILLDVVMPRMDGVETCRKLRAHEVTRLVPIIMVTTRADAENVETAYRTGCNGYVAKPIDGPELLDKVRSFLGD
jgi:CheY-like chemotaxis protein